MAKKLTKKATKTLKNMPAKKIKAQKSERVISVKNADGDPDTTATILIQNKINYTPKVSVIIPVFNAADYLIECLNSVTNQTLSEIEIICVNDGSVDSSLEILQDYAKKDSRITVINQENHGAGIARNCGIGVARGEFVAFMDPDDFYPTNKTLEHLYNTAIEKQVNICGGTMNRLKDGKIIVADEYLFNEYGLIKYSDYQFDYGYTRFIYNRKLLFDNNVLFPDYLRGQDPVFFVRAMILARKFYAIDETTYVYRIDYKEIKWTQRKLEDAIKSWIDVLKISKDNNLLKLHKNILGRLNTNWFINIFKNLYNMDSNTDLFKKIYDVIDFKHIDSAAQPTRLLDVICNWISVIVPVYNVEKYLSQCLDSVINQTYKQLEILCINDGSTDGSLKILEQYAAKDKRIRIISKENEGLSTTRNLGIRQATGKYILFLDSDDWLDLTCFENLFNSIEANKSDLCIYGLTRFDESSNSCIIPDNYFNLSCYKNVLDKPTCTYLDIQTSVFRRWESVVKLYRRGFLLDNNILFTEKVLFEDIFFHIQSILSAKSICFCDKNLYYYRVNRPNSIMDASKANIKCLDIFKAFEDIKAFLLNKQITVLNNEYVNFVLKQADFHYNRCVTQELKKIFIERLKDFVVSTDFVSDAIQNNQDFNARYRVIICDDLVSVIIPVYNVEKYLAQCLDSVINQTYKNIEIICVNDGSTDNSLKILEKYAKKDSRIKVISQKNAGLNGARNTGLHNMNGTYLTFLDSDDWMDIDWIEKAYNIAVSNGAQIVKSGYLHHFEDKIEQDSINKIIDEKVAKNLPLGVNENNIVVWATLYDRAFIENNNLFFDPDIRKHEDILYTLKATFLANKILPLSGTYINYRRTSSILSAFNKNVYDIFPIIHSRAISFLNNITCDKQDYINAVKRLWWRTQDAYEKRDQAPGVTDNELQTYLDKNYEIFRNVRWPYDIFDKDTIDKLGIIKNKKNALLVEINDCHGECLPGYCKYLLDLGYNVDVLVNKVLEKEAPMQMFDGNPFVTTRYISDKEIFGFLNSKQSDIYDVCVFNSNILYNEYNLSSILNFINLKQIKPRVLCVEHRLENLPELTLKVNVLVLKKFYDYRNTFEVNPHYFGENKSHDKGKTVNFVVAGNIQKTRKNYDLLINAVNELVSKNITNFKITVIGRGNLGDLPEKIQKFFDIKGRVSYPDLYKYVSNADFFMTLLDPDFSEHDRYLKHGTSGSFQLIYGLNIPCLIASKFAKCHHFSKDNSIVYKRNSDLAAAMIKCINMSDSEYNSIKNNLQETADKIYKNSLHNLETAINTKLRCVHIKSYALFPYYLLATMWMRCVKLPVLRTKKRINQFLYTHSYRGHMDFLNANFSKIMQSIQSVQSNTNKQIANIQNQQNELARLLNSELYAQKQLFESKYNQLNTAIVETMETFNACKIELDNKIDTVLSETNSSILNISEHFDDSLAKGKQELKSEIDAILSETNSSLRSISEHFDNINNKTIINMESLKTDVLNLSNVVDKQKYELQSDIAEILKNQNEYSNNIENILSETKDKITVLNNNFTNSETSLNTQFKDIKNHSDILFKQNSEPYWANIYHDTINDSTWLKKKSVSPGRWAVSYIVLYVLYRILDEIKPQSILECGLGQSSKLTIQYAETNNAKLTICENNPEWLSFFKCQFPTADKYTKILDTEMVNIVPEYESRTYANFKNLIKDEKFDLILIDGPLGSEHYSRPEILDIVDNLNESFIILLDDMNRIGEQETWNLLKNKLKEKGISFKEKIYSSDKSLGMLVSQDLQYLTSL